MTAVQMRVSSRPVPVPSHPPVTASEPAKKPSSRTDWLIAGGLTAVVLALLSWNITGFPTLSDDEGTYLAQAWAVQQGKGLAHYTYWYDHPPLAWIQLAALSWLPGLISPDLLAVGAGRIAMLPFVAASLLLVYLVARRLGMARWGAALALATYGLSPLFLTMGRQIYLDTFAVVWLLAAIALALSPRKHLWHYSAAGAAAAIAVLSKETILVAMPAVLLALWQNASRSSTRPWALAGFFSGLVLTGAFYPLYAMLRGELFPGADHVSLIGAWQFQLGNRSGSGSVFQAGSGTHELVKSWLYYDSVILIGGLAAAVAALFVRNLRIVGVASVIFLVVALRPGGYLPAMYVVQVLPFFALATAGVVYTAVTRLQPSKAWWRWAVVGVAAAAALAVITPRWIVGVDRVLNTDDNAPYAQAVDYLRTLPDRADATVVVDDAIWLDCVNAGYAEKRVLWFYKIDLDAEVKKRLRNGWRDVDYIVSSPAIRQDPGGLQTVSTLLEKSSVIASFGAEAGRIEIRRVNKEKA